MRIRAVCFFILLVSRTAIALKCYLEMSNLKGNTVLKRTPIECPISKNSACVKIKYMDMLTRSCSTDKFYEAASISTNECLDDMEEVCNRVNMTKLINWEKSETKNNPVSLGTQMHTPEQCKKFGEVNEDILGMEINLCTCTSNLCNTAERKAPTLYITAFIQICFLILFLYYTT